MTLPKELSTEALASLLGIAPRTIAKLTEKDVLHRLGYGKFDLRQSVRNYLKYREACVATKLEQGELGQARLALLQEKVRMAKMDRLEREGKLVPSERWTAMNCSIMFTFRTALLTLPTTLASELNPRNPALAEASLRGGITECLRILQGLLHHVDEATRAKIDQESTERSNKVLQQWEKEGKAA